MRNCCMATDWRIIKCSDLLRASLSQPEGRVGGVGLRANFPNVSAVLCRQARTAKPAALPPLIPPNAECHAQNQVNGSTHGD